MGTRDHNKKSYIRLNFKTKQMTVPATTTPSKSQNVMGSLLGGGVVSGGLSLLNNILGVGQAKKEREYQKEMATTAYQRDVEMWNTQNAYNAPAAQMERLKEAGLNPNMVYGSGSATGNTSGSMPKHQSYGTPTAQLDIGGIMNVLGQFTQIKGQTLKNEEQAIINGYLDDSKKYETSNTITDALKGQFETGATLVRKKDGSWGITMSKNAPYTRKYQEQVESLELDNFMKEIFKDSHQKLPPWAKSLLPLIQTIFSSGLRK